MEILEIDVENKLCDLELESRSLKYLESFEIWNLFTVNADYVKN